MVAKIVLDEITSSGSGITIDSAKTFTVNGTLLSVGSTNVLHKTGDYTIVTGDVASKSELIITTTTATPRDIILPLVGVTGVATCVITVVVSADATGTNSVRVMNAGSEAWTGYQKGDFARFCVSDGAWVVLDHKETYFSARYLTANQTIAASATSKLTGFTNVTEIGNGWDNTNDKFITPFAGYCDTVWLLQNYATGSDANHSLVPALYVGGSLAYVGSNASMATGHNYGGYSMSRHFKVGAAVDVEFYSKNLQNTSYANVAYSGASATQFSVNFTRAY